MQRVFDALLVLAALAGGAGVDHKAAVGQSFVVRVQLFLRDKMHRRVIVGKIVGHRHDFALDFRCVRAVLEHDVAFAGVLFARGQLGGFAFAHRFDGSFHRHGVLLGVRNAGNAADRVAVTLRNAAAPEGVAAPFRQHGGSVEAVEREQPGIPARGDQRQVIALARGFIHGGKVFRNLGVGVKGIHDVE